MDSNGTQNLTNACWISRDQHRREVLALMAAQGVAGTPGRAGSSAARPKHHKSSRRGPRWSHITAK